MRIPNEALKLLFESILSNCIVFVIDVNNLGLCTAPLPPNRNYPIALLHR